MGHKHASDSTNSETSYLTQSTIGEEALCGVRSELAILVIVTASQAPYLDWDLSARLSQAIE